MLKVRTKKDFLKDFNKHILSGRITESDVASVVDCLKEQKPLQQKSLKNLSATTIRANF